MKKQEKILAEPSEFGMRLRELRQKHGVTQAALAKACMVTQSWISALEKGQAENGSSLVWRTIAQFFQQRGEDVRWITDYVGVYKEVKHEDTTEQLQAVENSPQYQQIVTYHLPATIGASGRVLPTSIFALPMNFSTFALGIPMPQDSFALRVNGDFMQSTSNVPDNSCIACERYVGQIIQHGTIILTEEQHLPYLRRYVITEKGAYLQAVDGTTLGLFADLAKSTTFIVRGIVKVIVQYP